MRGSLTPEDERVSAVMPVWDSKTHSFIVKIWLEETVEEAGTPTWRGHVTHVGDEERRYLESLDEIPAFIAPYLKEMGVRFERSSALRQWVNRWKHYLTEKG